jgi:hypothetical protein
LSTGPHDDVLSHVERAFGLVLDRSSVVHGVDGTTEGFRTDRGTWLRIDQRPSWRIKSAAWVGLEAASTIEGVPMPQWHQGATWADHARALVWRADEMQFVVTPSVKAAGGRAVAVGLPDSWWTRLRESLHTLGKHDTERVGMSQQHLTMRISQVFEDVDTTVDEWATAHTDLQWGNVTTDGVLLDWADWGAAPRGHDAASLWQASLPNPDLAARVQQEFAADLQTRSGKLAQLLHCANAIRVAKRLGTETPLSGPASAAAERLLADLHR